MHLRMARRHIVGVLVSTLVSAGTLVPATAAEAAVPAVLQAGFTAYAYGTNVFNADWSALAGPTAYVSLACTTTPDRKASNNAAVVSFGKFGKAGASVTTVGSEHKDEWRATESTSTIAGVTLLGGMIKAKAVTAKAMVRIAGDTWGATNDSVLTELTILGKKIDVRPARNTKVSVALPGLGTIAEVTLNEQQTRTKANGTFETTTTAMHVKVLPGSRLGNTSTVDVLIGRANAQLTPPTAGYLGGRGFVTKVSLLDGTVRSGPTSLVSVPCLGGVSSNRIAAGDLGHVAKVKFASTRAEGTAGDLAHSKVSSAVAKVSLLGGLVTADAIKSVASAKRSAAGPVELSDEGSTFVNLEVNGKPVLDSDVGPNTKFTVHGAEITLNKIRKTDTRIAVTQIEIVIRTSQFGLPAHSKVEVAYASASVLPT